MTFDEFVRLTRRHVPLLLTAALIGVLLSALLLVLQPKKYTASAGGYVVAPSSSGSIGDATMATTLAQSKAKSYVDTFTSQAVAERVIRELDLDTTAPALASSVAVNLPQDSVNLTVEVTSDSPGEAKRIADALVRQTATYVAQLDSGSASAGGGKKDENAAGDSAVKLVPVASAQLPSEPSSPLPTRFLPAGFVLGLLAGYLLAFFRDRQDTRIRQVEQLESASGSGVLAVLPSSGELHLSRTGEASVRDFGARESIRKLRTNLRYVDVDHSPRRIVITSANMAEGKSTVAGNLARAIAAGGEPTVLVDGDLRRPGVADMFRLENSVGLAQALAGTIDLDDVLHPTDDEHLFVITSGETPPNPSELVGSDRMRDLLTQLGQKYFVVIDAPPLLPVTDAALLTRSADGCVLVVASGDTRVEQVEKAVENIKAVNGRLLGAILNRVTTKRLDRIRYGDAEYGYGSSSYGSYGGGYGATYEQQPVQDSPPQRAEAPSYDGVGVDESISRRELHGRKVGKRKTSA